MARIGGQSDTVAAVLSELGRYGTWEGGAARRMGDCRSVADLIARLDDADVNVRLVAIRSIVSCQEHLGEHRSAAIEAFTQLLTDDSMNEFAYAAFQADDEEPAVRVSDAASWALRELDPEWKPKQAR